MAQLIEEHGWTKRELARFVEKSPSYVSNHLRLLRLPDAVKDAILSGIVSEGHGRALSTLDDNRDIMEVFDDIIRYGYSVRFTEQVVEKKRKTKRAYGKVSPEFKEIEANIRREYHIDAVITRRRSALHLTMKLPYNVVGFRTLRTIARRLTVYKPE